MKPHTNGFKNGVWVLGRQLRGIITYDNTVLEEEIYAITPHYKADLLKSVMKQLDLELSVDIPLETVINCQIGILVNGNYEMLNFGDYVVYSSEKQEDTKTYKIVCYDKMIYAMKQNESLEIAYPISIRNYLIAIATKLGLTVSNTTFYNQNMTIPSELYVGLQYTYRDILDEIAQVTGGIIYINSNNEIDVKYPTNTNDTIDEDFLKDINVDFGEKYGPINSIVLSRSGESDNVYLRDEQSVQENGLCEIKIVDNQIMNFNNRSDFLPGILQALDGLQYYINNFNSPGILYYEVGDLYSIQVGEQVYLSIMLNDEINVTTGIEEIIYTDKPEQTVTDYTKADKTDRKVNQTYLIVDKQNQTIESVVSNVEEQNETINEVKQTVNELNSKISDIADITTSQETLDGTLNFEGINQSEPIEIKIHPTTTNISYLYPRANGLYPSDTQYLPNRVIAFTNTTESETVYYELPEDLLISQNGVYDEFYLGYDQQVCQVTKRCGYNADGTVYELAQEEIHNYAPSPEDYPTIPLTDGDYTIQLLGYNNVYMSIRLMAQNIYTTQFATKAEVRTEISQTARDITVTVSENYATKNDMETANSNISTLQITAQGLTSRVGSVEENKVSKNEVVSEINQSSEAVTINANKINLNGVVTANNNFKIKSDGSMEAANGKFTGGIIELTGAAQDYDDAKFKLNSNQNKAYMSPSSLELYKNNLTQGVALAVDGIQGGYQILAYSSDGEFIGMGYGDISLSGDINADGYVYARNVASDKKLKENIEDSDLDALKILKEIKIKSFDWKKDKSHVKAGFIAQDLEKIDRNFVLKRNYKNRSRRRRFLLLYQRVAFDCYII